MSTPNHSDSHWAEHERILAIVGSSALAKSCQDDFDHALKLRSGEVIRYETAEIINHEWIHLSGMLEGTTLPFPAERGIDVRISEILWVMDAPQGS